MKILYLCADPGVPVFGRKGCSTHVREKCRSLIEIGHKVCVLCTNAEGDSAGPCDFDVIPVEPYQSRKLGFDLRRILTDQRFHSAAARLINEWKPDAIYERYSLYSASGGILAHRKKLPHILEVNAFITREQEDRLSIMPLAQWVERRVIRRARHVVVVSEPLQEEIAQLRAGDASISRMPMAVNLKHFHPNLNGSNARSELRASLGWQDRFIIGYVGTLTGWHGINLLYELGAHLEVAVPGRFAILVVGGDEKRLEVHRAKVRVAGLEHVLQFIGAIPYADVPDYMRAFDAGIIPDTTPWSSPAKLFEYQGCALPVLAPRYPAIERAMIHGREGFIFDPQNVAQIAGHAQALAADPELRHNMGQRGRKTAEDEHSWESQARAVIEIFDHQLQSTSK